MIKTAKLPQERFTTQGGRTQESRENIYYFKPFDTTKGRQFILDQDVLQNSHEAGVGGLESEILNGFVSFIKSIYECQKKGKDPKEALKHTVIATLKGGAYSYGIASGGSLLGGHDA